MPRHLTGDAHEWINEIPTVPTYSLANLQPSQRSWVYLCVITFDVTRFNFFRQGFFVFYNKLCYEQQRGKKTLLSLTLICYCHLVGMAKIVRGSTLYDHETPLLDDLADLLYIKYGIAFSSFVLISIIYVACF